MQDVIKIENLNKSYGNVKAVTDLSFKVKKGELFAFLGVNGAGKSTTISIMCGTLEKDAGKVYIDGVDTDSLGEPTHQSHVLGRGEREFFKRNLLHLGFPLETLFLGLGIGQQLLELFHVIVGIVGVLVVRGSDVARGATTALVRESTLGRRVTEVLATRTAVRPREPEQPGEAFVQARAVRLANVVFKIFLGYAGFPAKRTRVGGAGVLSPCGLDTGNESR